MKFVLKFIFLAVPLYSIGQQQVIGEFRDHFGSRLKINADSTFYFRWLFDTQESWSQGIWTKSRDTIYLRVIPKYDTLKKSKQPGIASDSLVLAQYRKPMTVMEIALSNNISQNRVMPPPSVFYRKNRLYLVENGQLDKSKQKGFWTRKKFPTWFFRSKN